MSEYPHIWDAWARILHRWGVQEVVAALLEAAGPLNLIAAQAVYIGQPLLNQAVSPGSLEALTDILEDRSQTRAFVSLLREVSDSGSGA
jgi:hypothetical protein